MIFIYGLGKSGVSVVKYFNSKKINFHCWDDKAFTRKQVRKNFNNIQLINPKKINFNDYDDIILSPGISYNDEKFKKINNKKIKFKRDLNIYWKNKTKSKIIAITGTNGKSTTTKLIGNLFKKNNSTFFIGGNLGTPLLNAFLNKKKFTYHVIELSSFQLENINDFNPKVAILLNLARDHLDRYKNYKDYINQKKNIFSKNRSGYNILSIDDKESFKLYKNNNIKNKISFSILKCDADIFYKKGYIYDNYFFKKKKISINKISPDLLGEFNFQNILATYIVSKLFNISNYVFLKTVQNYIGLPYRNKIIKQNRKFLVINNSKATNVDSTFNSLLNFNKVYLILGGRAKETDFKKIIKLYKRIKKIYVYGESANLIFKELKSKIEVEKFLELKTIVKKIFIELNSNSEKATILFSPACTSYDQYNNFEERGKHFTELINKYSKY